MQYVQYYCAKPKSSTSKVKDVTASWLCDAMYTIGIYSACIQLSAVFCFEKQKGSNIALKSEQLLSFDIAMQCSRPTTVQSQETVTAYVLIKQLPGYCRAFALQCCVTVALALHVCVVFAVNSSFVVESPAVISSKQDT